MAIIVLLAHAAVPHHHHKKQVCIEGTHCENDCKPHQHDANSHSHEHDGETGSDFCILKQLVVLPSNQAKQDCKCSFLTDGHSLNGDYQAIFLNIEFQNFRSIVVLSTDVSLRTPPYIFFVNSSLSLRAPPTV